MTAAVVAEHQVVEVGRSQRFWSKVAITPSCWLWTAALSRSGYGTIKVAGKTRRAHVVSFISSGQTLDGSLELDHLCRVRNCVNPAHLQQVTHRENVLRSENHVARYAKRTLCDKGHPFDGEHHSGHRRCTTCYREYQRVWAAERRRQSPGGDVMSPQPEEPLRSQVDRNDNTAMHLEADQPPNDIYVEDDAEDTPTIWLHRHDAPDRPMALLQPGNLGRRGQDLLWDHIVRGLPTSAPTAVPA